MRKTHACLGTVLGATVLFLGQLNPPTETPPNPSKGVVGVYDSRAILFAHFDTDEFKTYLQQQKDDIGKALKRAKEAGDQDLVVQLEALGPAMQHRIHRQGFSNAPVDDLIALIQDRLPAIAESAGVDAIVSKWAFDYRDPEAKFVDVTELLVAEFDPSEETLLRIREIMKKDPVPLDQIDMHK